MLHRQVVEIHDAMLVLHDYATPELQARAGDLSESTGHGTDRTAAAPAYVLKGAREAKLAGDPPQRRAVAVAGPGCEDLAEEAGFLVRVAEVYATAPPPVLSARPHAGRTARTARTARREGRKQRKHTEHT
ncbi:DUF6545 domain-containing protein [Streptomyces sp. NL15-2K]|uniref:DUF6545 domain-containing protein n=1 Tax=Streptomyces sp. NL15-2K TaxID=376149 RepID=UPI0032AFA1D7